MAKLTPDQLKLLEEPNYAVVSTVDERGRPHATVVWIDTDGTDVIFNTTTVRAKARHLRANPYASVTVVDRHDFYRWVEIEGPVETTEEGAAEHIDKLSRKYDGQDFSNHDNRMIVRVHPRRVVQYHS